MVLSRKHDKLPLEFKILLHRDTQTDTQMTSKQENPKSSISNEIKTESKRGCRLAWFRLGDLGFYKDFGEWYKKNHKTPYKTPYVVNLVKKYSYVLKTPSRASNLLLLTKDKRRLVMSALANLSKYLGCYGYWRDIVKNSGLKWEKRDALETLISMLNSNISDTQTWLMNTVQALPQKYASVLTFTALTGLRPSEACMSTKLIVELFEQKRLNKYLDEKSLMLQHFRFKELFLRGNKNAYISFIAKELLDLILKIEPRIKYTALVSALRKRSFKIKTKELRKLHATTLRDHLPQELIDLLQGRVSQSVFLRFYYKPFLQDIRDKTLKGIEPLQNELLELLS